MVQGGATVSQERARLEIADDAPPGSFPPHRALAIAVLAVSARVFAVELAAAAVVVLAVEAAVLVLAHGRNQKLLRHGVRVYAAGADLSA